MTRRKSEVHPAGYWPALVTIVGCVLAITGCERLPQKLGPLASPVLRFNVVGLESGVTFVHSAGSAGDLLPYQQLGAGCAVFDYNNDGWLDLYFPQGAPVAGESGGRDWSNRLYQGTPGFAYIDVTKQAGVEGNTAGGKLHSIGCAVGDWNNDGFDDLLVAGNDGCLLYQNSKNGTFSEVSGAAGLAQKGLWTSATFIDYDRDGWLDLFVCRYAPADPSPDAAAEAPPARASTPALIEGSRLYRNEGGVRFRDVTVPVGVLQPRSRALGVVATDFNNDGWIDLCVTNDGLRNYLFQNDRGIFLERGRDAGMAVDESGVARAGRGVLSAGLVGDPLPDLLFTHGAGLAPVLYRTTRQDSFAAADAVNALPASKTPAPGWGAAVGDLDLDGLLDCVLVSGSDLSRGGATSSASGARPQVLLGSNGGWQDATLDMGRWFQEAHDARGVVLADLDNDGDLDIVVTVLKQPPVLLRNEQRLGNHWFELTLVGTTSNLGGLGSRVTALLGDRNLVTEVRSSSGFATSGDRRLCLGLGTNRSIDGLEIRWPSGTIDALPAIAADRAITLKEGGELVSHRRTQ